MAFFVLMPGKGRHVKRFSGRFGGKGTEGEGRYKDEFSPLFRFREKDLRDGRKNLVPWFLSEEDGLNGNGKPEPKMEPEPPDPKIEFASFTAGMLFETFEDRSCCLYDGVTESWEKVDTPRAAEMMELIAV